MKILIVDDDFTNRKILTKYLSEYGQCDSAVNGQEAINAFQSALKDGERYDLILLDIMMPVVDGQEALMKIRQIEKDTGKYDIDGVKVIMTTALDDHESIKDAFREQCEAYLVKPIDRQKLINIIKELDVIKAN